MHRGACRDGRCPCRVRRELADRQIWLAIRRTLARRLLASCTRKRTSGTRRLSGQEPLPEIYVMCFCADTVVYDRRIRYAQQF